jgi:multidrug transporter EmrE-like cation transporter
MNIVLELLLISFIGTVGNILFKIGTDGFGELTFSSFFTREFILKAFTSKFGWIIFVSLIINFTSRVLIMSPISKEKYGIVWSLTITLGMISAVLSGYLIFHETYTIKEIFGIGLTLIGMWFITTSN